ncbi:MAG TPA: DUF4236 domain-containing protein [Marinospirillum sp.]|uniref:DUF4236 domain-containing protein n=1 Tax=Marinospirillum sp. TaxID=2183934 RepID=UPI002B467D7E|nr:DUF4236 domain-containing protein [Marinospirillum sp.]HKM14297.1 DUF4236 domain-containing protein [Marinospirillum sp.]
MAFRFRNSIRIAPGIRLNIGKNGVSVSAGVRGATVTAGSNGVYGNVGLPGTGLSYRTRLDKSANQRKRSEQEEKHQSRRERQQATLDFNKDFSELVLTLDAKGGLLINTVAGQPLPAEEHRKLLLNYNVEIHEWLAEQMDKINGNISLLLNPHLDILTPDTTSLRHQVDPFTEPKPKQPIFEPWPLAPQKPVEPQFTWKDSLLPGRKNKRLRIWEEDIEAWKVSHQAWQIKVNALEQAQTAPLQAYREALGIWRARKEIHDTAQRELAATFADRLATDTQVMTEVLKAELNALDWARETLIDFELDKTGRYLKLDVDLPEIESFPTQEARQGVRDLRLVITDKSPTQVRREYARHIHGVILRVIGTAFHSLPSLETLIISGYSQRLNTATGHIQDDYLFSAKVKRSVFAGINFHNLKEVDPIIALERFELVRDMSKSGIFRPIEPIQAID